MYIAKNIVRMHDTDMAGILYFPRQFRFCHDALEDFVAKEGLSFNEVFNQREFVFVIKHCEAEYLAPLFVGDELTIQLHVGHIGTTSFVIEYEIIRDSDQRVVGTAQTVHVTLDNKTRKKIPVPEEIREKFSRFTK